jgi:outer membrane lipoprotein-sorting protein
MLRKHTFLAVAVAAILASTGAGAQQTVEDIVAKNLQAKGGLAKIKAVQSVRRTTRLNADRVQVRVTVSVRRPGMVRQEIDLPGQRMVMAYDGTTAWKIDPLSGGASAVAVMGPDADGVKDDSDLDGPLVDYKNKGYTLELVGTETLAGRKVHHLALTAADRPAVHYYLDAETGLESRIVSRRGDAAVAQDFSDFRDVDGLKVPFSIRQSTNGVEQARITVEKVEFNVKLDDALFKKPAS